MIKFYKCFCKTFEGAIINSEEFDEPLNSYGEELTYAPTLSEIKRAYGKGWGFVRDVYVYSINAGDKTSDDWILISHNEVNQ